MQKGVRQQFPVSADIDNVIVADATSSRSIKGRVYIIIAELEKGVKAIYMYITIRRRLKNATKLSDLATVCWWMTSVSENNKNPKVSSLSKVI